MSNDSNGKPASTPMATNVRRTFDNDKRRKSKPKIARPVLTDNKSRHVGTKKPWQKIKTLSTDQKDEKTQNDSASVRFEVKDGEGASVNMQMQSSDMQIMDVGDEPVNAKSEIFSGDMSTEIEKLNEIKDITCLNTPIKEKTVLTLPRAGSSKKEHSQIEDSDKGNEKKSLLSKQESSKTSLDTTSQDSVDAQLQNNATVIYPPDEDDKPKSVLTNDESYIRSAIPYLPLGLSVICLVMNIFIPGSGTIISGMSILCCGKSRLPAKDDQRMTTVCVNICVGIAQLFTVTFLLVGWFWSLAWGFQMVSLSVENKLQKKQQRERELQTLALSAFGNPVNVRPLFQHI